ncbi:methyltransferase type 11 [Lentzea sp. NBRC 105346]|uniref:class I SAM-dependent methyltransferase n=1 Tax=Lentzea sp. NBRC 105346 TaxID=3032205 RepID=UPI00249FA6F2|nr:class I SAM-dependent methyltransferase [Lentzea sp. NBRC 105346]GLZ35148.1 methyltransferase type 11 [Lentzea sp. NBRC 105346]
MPTLLSPDSAQARSWASSFGEDPERYDRTRPSYPDAMVDRIIAASPGRDVLDVGCGTGIAARQFAKAGCTVLGVEIDERMASFARGTGVDVEVARFEDWDPAGRTFDLVISGQTWHWIHPVAGAAKAKEALRPGGRLAVFWNAFHLPPECIAVFHRVIGVAPSGDGYGALARRAAEGMGLGEPEYWEFEWERPYTRAEWLDQVPTMGGFSQLTPNQQAELLKSMDIGDFTMRYTATVVTAVV